MSPQLRAFLKALMIDLTENHDWNAWIDEMENEDNHVVFQVAEKHAHLVESTDWKEKRKDEISHQIKQLAEELKTL